MPLLRKISRPKWISQNWMIAGDVPADALVDLRTTKNELSVWRLEADATNLNTIIAALASNKTASVDKFDYVVISEDALDALPIQCVQTTGDSPHADANAKWHCDLVGLTAAKIVGLANEVKRVEASHQRLLPQAVKEILRSALAAKQLQRSFLTPTLLAELE